MQWRGEGNQDAAGLGSYEDYALSKEVWGCDPSQTRVRSLGLTQILLGFLSAV